MLQVTHCMKPHRWYRLRSSIPAFAIVAASLCLAGCPSVPETNSPPQPPSRMDPQRGGILRPDARPPMLDQRRFDEAAAAIRRLPIDSFPQLPEAVAGVLREKGCLVPQPEPEGPGVNVISGEFFAAGQAGWAVLCSTNGQSVILVFRDESGASPEELAPADDRGFLQGVGNGVIAYSRQISTVDRQYIVRHYRAYGGPKPPPIRHAGIDDAFLEKASVVHYWYEDTWLRLTGAD